MKFTELKLKGAFLVEIEPLKDDRGFFSRTWCKEEFEKYGLENEIKQENLSSCDKKGTLRGLHYQISPYQETKFVRCIKGSVYDVIVDLRPESSTYMQWVGIELSATNYRMIYVPKDFAHGYMALEDNSEVLYFVTQFYLPKTERGIRWDDPQINIQWPLKALAISDKDRNLKDYSPNVEEVRNDLKEK